ncbi:MAG: transposase [Desulfobacterales bacterium]|nr:transposase [Desulfobacterales bacterium]
MNPILLEKSDSNSRRNLRSNCNRTPDEIKRELDKALKDGFHTFYGGSFLLIPYLLHLGIVERINALKVEKQNGIPVEKAVLALLHLGIVGKKRISRVENVTDQGLAVFAGLGKMPDPSFFHDFLDKVKTSDAEQFNVLCSERFKEMGLFKGRIVNLDRHFISYFGKKKIGKDKHPTRNISMKGVNASFTHDQETGDPIFVRADYSGLKPEDVAIPMLNATKDIIGDEMETVVFDKWFSVGSLLDYIDKEMGIKYVTLLKLFQNRIEEMKSIPAEQFREMADGRKITFIHTSLRNYQGEAKLIVIWFQEDGEDKYYGYLTNDEESPEERTVTIYGKRWGIENFLKEVIFLNVDKLPGTELNKISAMLAIKLVGYCTVSCLRRDIGGDYAKMEIEGIFEKFLNVEAFVRSKGEKIHVTYYRYPPELVPLFQGLNEKLKSRGVNPKVPWLNNKILEFHFK